MRRHQHQAPALVDPEQAARELVDQLQHDVGSTLSDVLVLADLAARLLDSRQRRLGFLTPAALDLLDDLVRKERAGRKENLREGLPTGTGEVDAPGNFAGVAVAVEIWATLQHQIRRCSKHVAPDPAIRLRHPDQPTLADLGWLLRCLTWEVTDTSVLRGVLTDLTVVEEATQRFVDAVESSTPVNAPCPYCGRKSLVARFHEDLIRCERDPRSHHYEACVCPDPLCHCKNDATQPRHTWSRSADPDHENPREQGDWHALKRLIVRARTTQKGE